MTDTASPIVTPEAVVLDFVTAGVGSRCVAKLIDVVVQLMLFSVIAIVVGVGVGAAGTGGDLATVLLLIASFLILIGYPVIIETLWNGRTVGKSVMGVRTVTREGAPIRFRHASLRGIIGLVEVYAFGFIAVITAALSRSNQRVGDLAGGTIVIRERTAVNHAVSLTFVVPPGYETYADTLDVSALDTQQYQLIRSFLTRVLQLSPDARAAMALRLANPVAGILDHDPPAGIGPELFLVCVVAAYQRRHGGGPAPDWSATGWAAPAAAWGPPTGGGYGWGPGGQPPYAAPAAYGQAYGQPGYAAPSDGYAGYGPPPAVGAPLPGYGPPPAPVASVPPPAPAAGSAAPTAAPAPAPGPSTWTPPPPPTGWAPPPPAPAAAPGSAADPGPGSPPVAGWSAAPPGGFDPPA